MIPDRREFLTLGIGALVVATVPVGLRSRRRLVRRTIPVMGTLAEVTVPSRNEAWAQRAIDAAFTQIRRVESTMTRFRPDSDVGRLNRSGASWAAVSDDTAAVLERAVRWARSSDGRFDPCLGRASELWDVTRRTVPPESGVHELASGRLWRSLVIDHIGSGARARLLDRRAAVDLGGIAKGFAVDAAAQALRDWGVTDGLVNIGGDLVALGVDVDGDPWRIGIRSPRGVPALVAETAISDEALATSGDYVRFFQHGGRRYHHLLDPATGEPYRTSTRSLTVRAANCTDADAAATALFAVAGSDAADALARVPGDVHIVHHLMEA